MLHSLTNNNYKAKLIVLLVLSVEKNLTMKATYYPGQSMELNCTRTPETVQGTMKWKVNGKDPAENKAKYNITNYNTTLTVKDVNESDNGESYDLSWTIK